MTKDWWELDFQHSAGKPFVLLRNLGSPWLGYTPVLLDHRAQLVILTNQLSVVNDRFLLLRTPLTDSTKITPPLLLLPWSGSVQRIVEGTYTHPSADPWHLLPSTRQMPRATTGSLHQPPYFSIIRLCLLPPFDRFRLKTRAICGIQTVCCYGL